MFTHYARHIVNQQRYGNPHGAPGRGWCQMCGEDGPNDKHGAAACDDCIDAEIEENER